MNGRMLVLAAAMAMLVGVAMGAVPAAIADDPILSSLPPDQPRSGGPTPLDATWGAWIERAGERPPDWHALPSRPEPPDPLLAESGERVTTPEAWPARREEIRGLIEHWQFGTFPPPPDNLRAVVTEIETGPGEARRERVDLTFGPERRAKMTVELMIPPGDGPFPVFMTQANHAGWARVAVRRGYISAAYNAADIADDTEAYGEIYPAYDFSRLGRRAWGTSRVIDYLETRPDVDAGKIALTGHSRNGKLSLLAAAMDERVAAVISSSAGTGGDNTWRTTDASYNGETLEEITRNFPHWFHPRLRFFAGREDKLPVDQNLLIAMIAPRAAMLSTAVTESQGGPWGIERTRESVRPVWQLLGRSDGISILERLGQHAVHQRDLEAYVDYFDWALGRGGPAPENRTIYNFDEAAWREKNAGAMAELAEIGTGGDAPATRRRIAWALGNELAGVRHAGPGSLDFQRGPDDYLGVTISRPEVKSAERIVLGPSYSVLGDYVWANLYLPKERAEGAKVPVVIFLHGYGHQAGFGRRSGPLFEKFAQAGIAVLAYDMVGFGTRIAEAERFYTRYPEWSLMGRMVTDVRAAVDALQALEEIDGERIALVGTSLGGTVALLAAALDERIAAVAVESAMTPMRRPGAGQAMWWRLAREQFLMPRLGIAESLGPAGVRGLPFDFDQVMATIAPRPLLVIAPGHDWHADLEGVRDAVERARESYAAAGGEAAEKDLKLETPPGYEAFFDNSGKAAVSHELIVDFLREHDFASSTD